jgi:hypothetical protein
LIDFFILFIIKSEKWKPGLLANGFFVRLNTRSPKDALILSKEMFEAIAEDKKKLESEVNIARYNQVFQQL